MAYTILNSTLLTSLNSLWFFGAFPSSWRSLTSPLCIWTLIAFYELFLNIFLNAFCGGSWHCVLRETSFFSCTIPFLFMEITSYMNYSFPPLFTIHLISATNPEGYIFLTHPYLCSYRLSLVLFFIPYFVLFFICLYFAFLKLLIMCFFFKMYLRRGECERTTLLSSSWYILMLVTVVLLYQIIFYFNYDYLICTIFYVFNIDISLHIKISLSGFKNTIRWLSIFHLSYW